MDLSSSTENIVNPAPNLIAEIARLTRASNEEVERISKAALLHQRELLRQVDWCKEEQQVNIAVGKIRLQRDIERLVREKSGEVAQDGPILKLPIELVSYIFRCYIALDMSPWRLVKVCKSWMRIAQATPRLWRHICVTRKWMYSRRETWVVDGEKRISLGRTQICTTVVQLHAALRRSGAVPLEIEADFNDSREGSSIDSFLPLLRVVLSDPVSTRLETLNMANLWIGIQSEVSIGRFPLLREVELPKRLDSWTHSLLESVCQTVTQFDTLRLQCEIPPELVRYSFWPLLKELELPGFSLGQFNNIADKLTNLQELRGSPNCWPDKNTPLLTWEKIRHTSIDCDASYLGRARLPNLTSLVFSDQRGLYQHEEAEKISPPISFPKLRELRLETQDPRWFAKASLPLLAKLTVLCEPDDQLVIPEVGSLFNATTLPALEALTLETPWFDSTLVDILTSLPNLITVVFTSTQLKDQSFGLLLLKRLEAHQPLLCPNLVSMSLGTEIDPIRTLKRSAVPLLKRLVSSRKKIGKPLGMLSVYWAKGTLVVENYA